MLRLGCRQGQGCAGLRHGRGTGGSVVQGANYGSGSDGGGRGWDLGLRQKLGEAKRNEVTFWPSPPRHK